MSVESSDKPAKHGWGALAGTFWASIAFLGPQFLVVPLIPIMHAVVPQPNMRLFFLQIIVQLSTLLILWLVIRAYKLDFSSIGLNKTKPKNLLLAAVAFPIYLVISVIFTTLISAIYPVNLEQEQVIGYASPNIIELILVFIALVIITPLVEEMVFRGFLLRAYARAFGAPVAAVVISLVFAVAHGQLNVALDTFILSLFLCYLRFTTNSLWPSVLLHAIKNFVAFCVLFIIGVK